MGTEVAGVSDTKTAQGLTAAKVRMAALGRYGDGDGLYLLVRHPEAAFWIFRYTIRGRMREIGLGRARGRGAVPLASHPDPIDEKKLLMGARDQAAALRRLVRAGIDPLEQRATEAAADLAAVQAEQARRLRSGPSQSST